MNTLVGQEAKANRTLCGLRRVSVRTMAAARMEVTSAARAAGVISDGNGNAGQSICVLCFARLSCL